MQLNNNHFFKRKYEAKFKFRLNKLQESSATINHLRIFR